MNKSARNNRFRPNTSRETTMPGFDFMYGLELSLKIIMVAILVSLTTLLFIFIENAVTQSNLLAIKEISVSGTRILSKEEVIEQAELFPEDNIFSVNLRRTRMKIISHPWIEDASVKRSLPSKIVITIREEVPLAVVHIPDRADIIINRKGVPFTENDAIGSDIFVNDIRNSTGMGNVYNPDDINSDTASTNNINTHSDNIDNRVNMDSNSNINAVSTGNVSNTGSDAKNINEQLTLPVITGMKLSRLDDTYSFSGRIYDSVMKLLLMKKNEVIQRISADEESGIEVDLIINSIPAMQQVDKPPELVRQPVKINIGFDNYEEKFKIIRHIINYMQKNKNDKQVSSIDVINPENVVIKIKDIAGYALPEHIDGGT
ncbi:MAG: FtsQ-type POTRA domain-containing protein [Desulfamplus sp.]|nr:FtsQ-type POTRA domain-containing protein [Desulfamplus sp.]